MALLNCSVISSKYINWNNNFGSKVLRSQKQIIMSYTSISNHESRNNKASYLKMTAEKAEIFKSLEGWAKQSILPLIKPVSESWQPQDFLPESSSEGFHDKLKEIRARAEGIPDECFVVLVGDMINEETLPMFTARLNGTHGFHDHSGVDEIPWAVWARGWCAEERRHSDILKQYLYLSGRVDMRRVETTVHHMLSSGMDIGTNNNPYIWAIYTTFQERATAISHGNTAKLALQHGDSNLAKICGTIASDEKRHETAYSKIVQKLFDIDPNETMVAFAYLMRMKVSMPAFLMFDGLDNDLFGHYSEVASRIGVYTTTDYRRILEHLLLLWNVQNLKGLSSEGHEAQDYLCKLPNRIRRLEERFQSKSHRSTVPVSFSWIYGRKA